MPKKKGLYIILALVVNGQGQMPYGRGEPMGVSDVNAIDTGAAEAIQAESSTAG